MTTLTKGQKLSLHAGWTDERTERLRALFADGMSASQIAKHFGDITRNQVIGKCARLGLRRSAEASRTASRVQNRLNHGSVSPRPKPVFRIAGSGAVFEQAQAKPPREPFAEKVEPHPTEPVPLVDLQSHQCRWPMGDPSSEAFGFCGRTRLEEGRPYCARHDARAYVRRTEAQRQADHARAANARAGKRKVAS